MEGFLDELDKAAEGSRREFFVLSLFRSLVAAVTPSSDTDTHLSA